MTNDKNDKNDNFPGYFNERAFLRAFLEILFGRLMKILYLCIVKEKRRNLRPEKKKKIACARGTCFLGKAKNGVDSEISKNN